MTLSFPIIFFFYSTSYLSLNRIKLSIAKKHENGDWSSHLRSRFIGVALTFLTFLLLGTFPGWHEEIDETGSNVEVSPFPSRSVSTFCLVTSALASMFHLVAALWQHINSSAAATMTTNMTYGAVKGSVGTGGMILAWGGTIFSIIVAGGLYVMIASISKIRQLTDEEWAPANPPLRWCSRIGE